MMRFRLEAVLIDGEADWNASCADNLVQQPLFRLDTLRNIFLFIALMTARVFSG